MKLVISASPHIDSGATTRKIMGDVLIALCPALIAAIVIFGWRALLVTAVCAAACVFFEWGFERLCHKESTIGDLSAVVTGVILAYNLPVSIPLWQAVFGCLVAIVAVKQLFGGIGKNFANPALVGRIVLFLSFSKTMTAWVFPDAVSSATPLAQLADHLLISTNREQLITTTDFALSRISAIVIIEVLYNFLLVGRPGAKGFVGRHEGLMAHDKDVR